MMCSHSETAPSVVASLSDPGLIREQNQDSVLVHPLDSALLLAVCDGMGGGEGGEVASQLAVTSLLHGLDSMEVPDSLEGLGRALNGAILGAHEVVQSMARGRRLRGAGTTATVALVRGNWLVLGQVGDSRAYLLRGGQLGRLTRDQSLAQQLMEQGVLQPSELATFEHSNVILQAVGTGSPPVVDLTWAELRREDVLLLCSDGLWGEVTDEEIGRILREHDEPEAACEALVEAAKGAGGSDNISCVVARLRGHLPAMDPEERVPAYRKLMFQDPAPPVLAEGASGAPYREDLARLAREEPVELPMRRAPWWWAPLALAALALAAGAGLLGWR
jgi:protein phosphatase